MFQNCLFFVSKHIHCKDFTDLQVDERSALDCHLAANFVDSLVGTCTKANDSVIIRLREIPMLPNEMSYKPDQDYFFISL